MKKILVVYMSDILKSDRINSQYDYVENIILHSSGISEKCINNIIRYIAEFHKGNRSNIRILNIIELNEDVS